MASENPKRLYPEVVESNPDRSSAYQYTPTPSSSPMYPTVDSSHVSIPTTSSSALYPSLDMNDLVEDLFPHTDVSPSAPMESVEQLVVKIPGAILHLIDKQQSVELAAGDLSIVALRQGDSIVAVFARVADDIQWPLLRDAASVKLDDSHYFFSLCFPKEGGGGASSDEEEEQGSDSELLNYGVTIASKGQDKLLKELDHVLGLYTNFSVQKVSGTESHSQVLDEKIALQTSPSEMKAEKKIMEERSAAYWTTLAPNVEEYSGSVARAIAAGSGHVIKGILWCGDVTVDRLKWGDEFLRRKMDPAKKDSQVSPQTLKRIKRAKKMTKMSQKVATGVLSGVVKVSGYFTSALANSKMGKKFFSHLPGEIVLASLDGFGRVCDAVEVAGKNVMSTSSVVTTGLVSHRHGEKAAEATHEGLDAAGHAIGTAWAVFKIRKALNPKGIIKPSSLAKSAAKAASSEVKSKLKK